MTDPQLTQSNRTRRLMLNVLFIIIATAGGVFVLDMWFDVLSWAMMGKLLLTLLVAAGILAVWLIIRSHIREEEAMTQDKFLN
jgi:hypothetical protein